MNCVYFFCNKHKKYTDAGYRWAYQLLEDKGAVSLGQPVDVDLVFAQEQYWHPWPNEANDWLCKGILPTVRQFLTEHREHEILYVDSEYLHEQWELGHDLREVKTSKTQD